MTEAATIVHRIQAVVDAQTMVNKAVWGLNADKVVNSELAAKDCRMAINQLQYALGDIPESKYLSNKKKLSKLNPL
jgi:hypothetical protein